MIDLAPELGVTDQVIAHFRTFQREGQAWRLLRHIGVINARAIEPAQLLPLARQERRNPVKNHSDSRLVAGIDERHEVGGSAIPGIGRVIARNRFIRCPKGQFDMGHVSRQQVREHGIG